LTTHGLIYRWDPLKCFRIHPNRPMSFPDKIIFKNFSVGVQPASSADLSLNQFQRWANVDKCELSNIGPISVQHMPTANIVGKIAPMSHLPHWHSQVRFCIQNIIKEVSQRRHPRSCPRWRPPPRHPPDHPLPRSSDSLPSPSPNIFRSLRACTCMCIVERVRGLFNANCDKE